MPKKEERKTIAAAAEDDDDSENDSDYDPGAEKDNDSGADEPEEEEKQLTEMSFSRKRKVDSVWEEMQLDDSKHIQDRLSKVTKLTKASGDGNKKKVKKQDAKVTNILASIFGSSQTKQIMKGVAKKSDGVDDEAAASIREAARESVKKLQKKQTVVETRKFAGEIITIERSAKPDSAKESNSTAAAGSALDKVLDTLKGPKSVSTVAKSSYDWENYKEKEGLDDALAIASKDGYLTRQEFLQRCDYRAFEGERDERLKTAATKK